MNWKEYGKKRRKNPEYREQHRKACLKWDKERTVFLTYAEKKQDPNFLRKARARNYIERHPELIGSQCEFCPSVENLQGHHPDYDHPTIIVTCCTSCHEFIDRGVD